MLDQTADFYIYIKFFINLIKVDDGVKWNTVDNSSTGNTWLRFTENTFSIKLDIFRSIKNLENTDLHNFWKLMQSYFVLWSRFTHQNMTIIIISGLVLSSLVLICVLWSGISLFIPLGVTLIYKMYHIYWIYRDIT
jgi:hypothetical protein